MPVYLFYLDFAVLLFACRTSTCIINKIKKKNKSGWGVWTLSFMTILIFWSEYEKCCQKTNSSSLAAISWFFWILIGYSVDLATAKSGHTAVIKVAQSDFSVTVPFYFDKQEFHHKRFNSKLILTVALENDESF